MTSKCVTCLFNLQYRIENDIIEIDIIINLSYNICVVNMKIKIIILKESANENNVNSL